MAIMICTDVYTMGYIDRGNPYEKLNLTPKPKIPENVRIENEQNERRDLMQYLIDTMNKKLERNKEARRKLSMNSNSNHGKTKKKITKRRVLRRKDHDKDHIGIYSVMTSPTNRLKVYLAAKTGLYLKMDFKGRLGGTNDLNNPDSK